MAFYQALPTMGYPTQTAAIVALYEAGSSPRAISQDLGVSINSVHRALCNHRRRNGLPTPVSAPVPRAPSANQYDRIWDMDEDERRDEIRRRSAAAARATRLAA